MSPALRNPGRDTIRAAQRLLDANPNRPEDRIRQDIGRLLDSLEIENLLTFRTRAGPADIFLPNRRIFIETKAAGLADDPHRAQTRENPETPFQQLERYLTAEMGDELGRLPLDEQPDLPWTGVVTDGRVWHAWRFPHTHPTTHELVLDSFRPQTGNELVLRIVKIDIKDRRLGLSLKSVNSTEYLDLDWEMAIQESATLRGEATESKEQDAQAEVESED